MRATTTEHARLLAADDHALVGVHERASGPHAVLLLHGISSERDEGGLYAALAERLGALGTSSLRFDFRGHGESSLPSAEATVAGMCLDLHAAHRYLRERHRVVSVVAASFAASVLLARAALGDLAFVRAALLNPVTDYVTTFTRASTGWAPQFLAQDGFARAVDEGSQPWVLSIGAGGFLIGARMLAELYLLPVGSLRWDASQDLLLVHGLADDVVDVEDSVGFLSTRVSVPAEALYLPAAGHGFHGCRPQVLDRLTTYLTRPSPVRRDRDDLGGRDVP